MATPVLFSKIVKGEDLDKVTTSQEIENKKNFDHISNYTKIIMGSMHKDTYNIKLSSTHGVISGQPISGNGVDEYTFIVGVNYSTNTVTVDRPILNTGAHISIIINRYPHEDDYAGDDNVFNYQYPMHVNWLEEDFCQNY